MNSILLLSLVLVSASSTTAPRVDAQAPHEFSRPCVARVADADGDGRPDFALARRHLCGFGFGKLPPPIELARVWIVSSSSGRVLRRLEPLRPATDFGRTLADVSDVDGDGVADVAVAGVSALWVFSGADGQLLHELGGALAGAGFARTIAAGHDADGDGRPDIAVYCSPSDDGGFAEGGVVALYSGVDGALLRVLGTRRNAGPVGVLEPGTFVELQEHALLGAMGFMSDRNGDRRAELAIATRVDDPLEGAREERLAISIVDPIDGRYHMRIPIEPPQMTQPWLIRMLPDIDGDCFDELVFTVVHEYLSIRSGLDGRELRHMSFRGGKLNGEGTSFDVLGDVNGDGVSEYLVGGNEDDFDCDDGLASMICGRTGEWGVGLPLWKEADAFCGPGADVCALGDVDGDSIPDALVAIPRLDQLRILSGKDFRELRRFAISPITEPATAASAPTTTAPSAPAPEAE